MSIELLHSAINPVRSNGGDFFDKFVFFAEKADTVLLTSGYVSADSILFLKNNVSNLPKMRIAVGMHHFDGFTRAQYTGLSELGGELEALQKGEVRVCTAFPFHGKVYSFLNEDGNPFGAIIGSSNLSCVTPQAKSRRVYEADLAVTEGSILTDIREMQSEILDEKISDEIQDYRAPKFRDSFLPLDGVPEAQSLTRFETTEIWSQKKDVSFSLPLKCAKKSNLNIYFGKGRENSSTGFVLPRPWYEIEIIVQKSITSLPNFPRSKDFSVVTDDGFKFEVGTQGANSKNFRSKGGLTVLGAWIKGRMENAGILKVGEFITKDHLAKYGRYDVELIATKEPDIWLLDFSVDGQ